MTAPLKYAAPLRPGQAPPRNFSHIKSKGSYSSGMGETPAVGRAAANDERKGATDFLSTQSFGNLT